METATHTIKAGQPISARSICDSDCVFIAYVIARKGDMLTIQINGEIIRKKVKRDRHGNEYVLALGSYSMAPAFT
jgi:hypothetical protein